MMQPAPSACSPVERKESRGSIGRCLDTGLSSYFCHWSNRSGMD